MKRWLTNGINKTLRKQAPCSSDHEAIPLRRTVVGNIDNDVGRELLWPPLAIEDFTNLKPVI